MSKVWIKLLTRQYIEHQGMMREYLPGDWAEVGKQHAQFLVAQGQALWPGGGESVPVVAGKPKARAPGFAGWTMFTIPREWSGIYKTRQENALASWQRLAPVPEIVLLYDDPGVRDAAKRLGCKYRGDLRRNDWGTPLISETFRAGQEMASHDVVCYCNTDIVLIGLGRAVEAAARKFGQFLVVGRRWDVDIEQRIDYAGDWEGWLRGHVEAHGALHNVSAIDYFGFRRGLYGEDVPDFAVGRSAWDNWLVSEAVRRGVPVVDATAVVFAVHQDRPGKGHKKAPRVDAPQDREKAINRFFYDRRAGRVSGTVKHAGWVLDEKGLREKSSQ